jgi:hypothetical protein
LSKDFDKYRGDVELAEARLRSPEGVTDEELAEILDRIFDDGEIERKCRLQDAREFKRDFCRKTGELIVSIRREGQEVPKYLDKTFLRPDERKRISSRALRSMAHFAKIFMKLELTDPQKRLIHEDIETLLGEVLRKVLNEVDGQDLKSA